jgi:hypothetical protein
MEYDKQKESKITLDAGRRCQRKPLIMNCLTSVNEAARGSDLYRTFGSIDDVKYNRSRGFLSPCQQN